VVDSQGSVLGVWVSPAAVSDARGARGVLEGVPLSVSIGAGSDTNRKTKVHKKQQLMPPSLRFPLRAGGTESRRASRGSPREAGGT
jgi:hypothetical protein